MNNLQRIDNKNVINCSPNLSKTCLWIRNHIIWIGQGSEPIIQNFSEQFTQGTQDDYSTKSIHITHADNHNHRPFVIT